MNKKRYDQIIDEAYINFVNSVEKNREEDYTRPVISKEEFVSEIKFHRDFSESWGLKIEERELSHDERYVWYKNNTHLIPSHFRNQAKEFEDKYIPHKLITLTYNNETIEVYE